jgi:hypothetical protein
MPGTKKEPVHTDKGKLTQSGGAGSKGRALPAPHTIGTAAMAASTATPLAGAFLVGKESGSSKPNQLLQSDVLSIDRAIASGAINTVDKVTFKKRIGEHSAVGFFKPNPKNNPKPKPKSKPKKDAEGEKVFLGDAAKSLGITDRPHVRALASSAVAELLGLDVLARTIPAIIDGKWGTVSETARGLQLWKRTDTRELIKDRGIRDEDRKIVEAAKASKGDNWGTVFVDPTTDLIQATDSPDGFIRRHYGRDYYNFDFTKPKTQKGLNDLQWLDALTGQVDRHELNMFIDPGSGQVTGIDHDASFPADVHGGEEYLHTKKYNPRGSHLGQHNLGLPALIDADTASRFENLSGNVNRSNLKRFDLNERELSAVNARLVAIKNHIKRLKNLGNVVGEWDQATYDFQTDTGDGDKYRRSYEEEGQSVTLNTNSYLKRSVGDVAEARLPRNKDYMQVIGLPKRKR